MSGPDEMLPPEAEEAPAPAVEQAPDTADAATEARERGLFRKDYVDTLLADPSAHITPLRGSKLWQLGLLEWWLQTHVG